MLVHIKIALVTRYISTEVTGGVTPSCVTREAVFSKLLVSYYRKIPTQRPPPSKRPPPFSAPKVLQRGHISSCNRPERLFLGTCRLTLYEKCSVMVTFLFHQLSCQMSSRAIAHPLVSGALNAKRPWAIGRDFTVL